jgi:hypothetical protein
MPGQDDGKQCQGKLYTYPENDQGLMFRFEIQSEVVQLNDFYQYGTPTIIVLERAITPAESSRYALGLGSAWSYYTGRTGCEWLTQQKTKADLGSKVDVSRVLTNSFDAMTMDALIYANSRLDQGHSGVVVDNRSGEMKVIANLNGLDQTVVNALVAMYTDAQKQLDGNISSCGAAQRDRDFGVNETIKNDSDGFIVANPWISPSESGPDGNGQWTVIIPPHSELAGKWNGGPKWVYPIGCLWYHVLLDVARSTFPVYHWDVTQWVKGPQPEPAVAIVPTPTPTPTP